MSTANSRALDDVRVGVTPQDLLALDRDALPLRLWGHLRVLQARADCGCDLRRGLGIKITQAFLMGASIYIAVASVMVFLSLVLRAAVSRWTNIVLPVLFIVSIAVSVIERKRGVLHLPEYRGDRTAAPDHLVRVDMAQPGRPRAGEDT